jgi:hypothetical protein
MTNAPQDSAGLAGGRRHGVGHAAAGEGTPTDSLERAKARARRFTTAFAGLAVLLLLAVFALNL